MNRMQTILLTAGLVLSCSSSDAAELFVYPQKGQSADRQQKDEFECYKWATEKSGFDPVAPPPPVTSGASSHSRPEGGALRGAAKGAALGAVGGAIAGDAGKGAAVGAGVGATAGAMRRARGRREAAYDQAEAQHQQQTTQQEGQASYHRAYSACLEGRGYTVK